MSSRLRARLRARVRVRVRAGGEARLDRLAEAQSSDRVLQRSGRRGIEGHPPSPLVPSAAAAAAASTSAACRLENAERHGDDHPVREHCGAPRHAHAHAAPLQRGDSGDRAAQPHVEARAQAAHQAVEARGHHLVPPVAPVGVHVVLRRARLECGGVLRVALLR